MPTRPRHPPPAVTGSTLVILAFIAAVACQLTLGDMTGTTQIPGTTSGAEKSWYALYFSDPRSATSGSLRGGPDKDLATAIRDARASVDVAAYQLDLWSLRDALIEAQRRGINVRMVTESDNLDEPEIQELIEAGIPVLGDRREGRMHNKFMVIDRQEVWTGSMNFTINGAYRNNNNLICIRSSRLAENYTTEFNEMFEDDRFGPGSPANTPHPSLSIEGTRVETYFSPDDGAVARLLELIEDAHESIYFLAFSFTSDDLAEAIIERARAGVNVAGVFEEHQYQSNTGTEYDNLGAAGLDVRLDGNPGSMHHKVIIIDGGVVITGSYNFSRSAEDYNDENILILHSGEIARLYLSEFERIYTQGR